jgi:hypothetical protein
MKRNEPGDALTGRQLLVFDYVRTRIQTGLAPTLREVGVSCFSHCTAGTQTTSALKCIKAIASKGYLRREDNVSRGIFLTDLGKE